MNQEEIKFAESVLNSLMKHPGIVMFSTGNGDPTLNTLSHIMYLLRSGGYTSVSSFIQAVESVFNSAETIYQDEYFAADFGNYFKAKFQNQYKKYAIDSLNPWSKRVLYLEQKISNLVTNCPLETESETKFEKDQKLQQQLTSERDMSQFAKAIPQLKDNNSQAQLKKIIEAEQPELLEDGGRVNTIKLKPKTTKSLLKKMKELYKAQGLTFPTN